METNAFLLRLRQGRPIVIDDRVFFSEKINESISVVYDRSTKDFSNVKPCGYIIKGRDYFVSFGGRDSELTFYVPDLEVRSYRKVERNVLSMLRSYLSDALNTKIQNITPKDGWDTHLHALLKFNSDEGLVVLTRGPGHITASQVCKSDFPGDFRFHVFDYYDKGFDSLKVLAAEYAERVPEVDLVEAVAEYSILEELYLRPESHMNAWYGKQIKSVLGDEDRAVKVEYIDTATGKAASVVMTHNVNANTFGGYLEGCDRRNDYYHMPFSNIQRIYRSGNGKCIYDIEDEKDAILSLDRKAAMGWMINLLKEKTGIWNYDERIISATNDSFVYCQDVGKFGVLEDNEVVMADGRRCGLSEDSIVFYESELSKEIKTYRDSILAENRMFTKTKNFSR